MSKYGQFLKTYKSSNIIFRAGIWFMLVTVIDKGISVITQPIINRMLTVDEVGIFGVYISWLSIFSTLATFNLFGGVLEVHLTKSPDKRESYVASLCSLSVCISTVFWTVFFLFGNQLSNLLGLKVEYLVLMALSATSEAIIQFWAVPKRFEYSYRAYAVLIVGLFLVKSVLSVLLAFYMTGDRVLGRILGLVIPAVCVAAVLFVQIIFNWRKTKQAGLFSYWKYGILFNLPLIPHYLSSILLASSDRVMIQQLVGDTDVGLYSVAYSFASLALIVFNALNSTYNPISMRAIKEKNYVSLRKSTELMVLLSIAFSCFMMLLAPEGLWFLGGDRYMSALNIVPILIVGIFFSSFYFVFSNVEFVYEKNKLIFPITLCGAVVNIVLNYLFIPKIGYKAAVYTTFIGYFIIAAAHYVVSRRIVGTDIYNIRKLMGLVSILFIGCFISLTLFGLSNYVRYVFVGILMTGILVATVKNRKNISKLIVKRNE